MIAIVKKGTFSGSPARYFWQFDGQHYSAPCHAINGYVRPHDVIEIDKPDASTWELIERRISQVGTCVWSYRTGTGLDIFYDSDGERWQIHGGKSNPLNHREIQDRWEKFIRESKNEKQ